MKSAQAAIFDETSVKFYYLEYQLNTGGSIEEAKQALRNSLLLQHPGIKIMMAFGKSTWDRLQPQWSPVGLIDFESLQGEHHAMPSTQRDVFFWIHGPSHDDNFDQVLHIQRQMQSVSQLKLDLAGFNYHNNMDLIGFEDGTANPKDDDRMKAALIPKGETGAGGSIVLSQKWVHDLNSFRALSDEDQGKVIGRHKHNNEEMEGDEMPDNSHISRTDLKIDGEAMKIYRRSDPYGNATEHGLYFLAFACDIKRLSSQLDSMLGKGDGIYDKLMDYSVATDSSYWFAPSVEDLEVLLRH